MPWYVQDNSELSGPFDDVQFKSLASAGRIAPETQIAKSREGPWSTASRVKGLFEAGAATQSARITPSSSSVNDGGGAIGLINMHAQSIEQLEAISSTLSHILSRFELGNNSTVGTQNSAMQYKVLTQKDKWFSGKFDPEKLEGAINSYAAQGWRVRGVATASFPGFGGNREEIVIVMERET